MSPAAVFYAKHKFSPEVVYRFGLPGAISPLKSSSLPFYVPFRRSGKALFTLTVAICGAVLHLEDRCLFAVALGPGRRL